jgi:hypothetical protein
VPWRRVGRDDPDDAAWPPAAAQEDTRASVGVGGHRNQPGRRDWLYQITRSASRGSEQQPPD